MLALQIHTYLDCAPIIQPTGFYALRVASGLDGHECCKPAKAQTCLSAPQMYVRLERGRLKLFVR
jgi:hypothetical protein